MPDQVAADMVRADAARLKALAATRRKDPGASSEAVNTDEEHGQFLPVSVLRRQYIDYLDSKVDEIEEQKDSRRYYHGAHWTAEQLRILRARHQPPTTWNRVGRKINSIVGLVERMRSDPKALPRHPKSESGAEIATQSIRFVLDSNEFKSIDWWCLLQCGIDGVGGVQKVLTKGDKGDPDVALYWVIGDEYFYDPRSYRLDFKDVRYEGLAKWIDLDAAIELFPGKEAELRALIQGDSDLTTTADREYKWIITTTKRIRLVEHWYKHHGKWCWAFYVADTLLEQGVSPFVDERGQSESSFHMFACARDQDGDIYSFVRNLKGPQDTLNQGKSKTLHLANTKLIKATKGVVDDVEKARREAARPDGWMEINPVPNAQFEIVDTKADLAAFAAFTEDAKAELDAYANTNIAQLSGVGLGNISGRALEILRQPGMAELGPFILSYRSWKLGLYRAIWNTVQRYWRKERWIRVNDNDGLAQFIQLNGDGLDRMGRPTLINYVGALDVDIILEEGPDVAAMAADTWEAFKGYPPGTFPPALLIEMNPYISRSDKNKYLQMLQPKPQPPNPLQQEAVRQQLERGAIVNAKEAANVRKIHASAEQALATADEKRVKAHTAVHGAHIDAAEFARDTLREAADVERQLHQPQPAQQPQAPAQ